MVDKHSLNCEVRELKLGSSFTNNKASQYHTIKYDFKPASVDVNKMATVDVGTNNQVTVTVPHLDGSGVPQTVFKGNQRPYTKECVLIIDRVTGEITLEKLSSNIQVKKTRQENAARPRPLTPAPGDLTNTTARSTSRTRVATNKRTTVPVPNPMAIGGVALGGGPAAPQRFAPAKPSGMMRSPPRIKTSPPQAAPWSGGGNSTLASLPMIGLDEPSAAPAPAPAPAPAYPPPGLRLERAERPERHERNERQERDRSERQERERSERERSERERSERERTERERSERERQELRAVPPPQPPVPVLPPASSQDDSSSSSSSDSGSDSGSDSDSDDEPRADAPPAPVVNGTSGNPALSDVLNDDLCLSESGSDSD